jgi:hypothetical protein
MSLMRVNVSVWRPMGHAATGLIHDGTTLAPDDGHPPRPVREVVESVLTFWLENTIEYGHGASLRIAFADGQVFEDRVILQPHLDVDVPVAVPVPPDGVPVLSLTPEQAKAIARTVPVTYGTATETQSAVLDTLHARGDRRWGRHVQGNTGDLPIDILALAEPAEGKPHQIFDFLKASDAQPPAAPPSHVWIDQTTTMRDRSRWLAWRMPRLGIHDTAFTRDGQPVILAGFSSFDLGPRSPSEQRAWIDALASACAGLPSDVVPFLRIVIASVFRTPRSYRAGLAQMPSVIQRAAGRGFYTELCTADSGEYGLSRTAILAFTAEIAQLCDRWPTTIYGGENEIGHGTVSDAYDDAGFRRQVAAKVPRRIPFAVGSSHGGRETAYDEGTFLTDHAYRKNTVEQNAPLMALKQARHGKPLIDEEPQGIAEVDRGESRTNDPERGFQQARLCREHGLAGTVLHLDAGLEAKVSQLGPIQRQAIARFVEGFR